MLMTYDYNSLNMHVHMHPSSCSCNGPPGLRLGCTIPTGREQKKTTRRLSALTNERMGFSGSSYNVRIVLLCR